MTPGHTSLLPGSLLEGQFNGRGEFAKMDRLAFADCPLLAIGGSRRPLWGFSVVFLRATVVWLLHFGNQGFSWLQYPAYNLRLGGRAQMLSSGQKIT